MVSVTRRVLLIVGFAALGLTGGVAAEEQLPIDPMSTEQLESASGKQGLSLQWQLNDNEQSAIVSDNVLNGPSLTGNNSIADQAFQNMSGIATVIQNTGNQVVIQDSTQVNILINR